MLVAAAFCPHPPVILPEVAGGACADLDGLRQACAAAIDRVLRSGAERIIVVGAGDRTRAVGDSASGTLEGFGIDVRAGWGLAGQAENLPLSLTVGAWLLEQNHCRLPVTGLVVGHDTSAPECLRLGGELSSDALGLLVMGDGSARRETEAPGYLDVRAVPFDDQVVKVLRSVDTAAIAELDAGLAAELLVAGRPAWQVAAGAVTRPMTGHLFYDEAPYGVGYFVVAWERK